MSNFTDLVARAVHPGMNREEREKVYDVVRAAVLRLQEREGLDAGDPRSALQHHLVEETIRDVEFDIVRVTTLEALKRAKAAQDAEASGRKSGPG
ncbi:hypothetical protein [Methylobacterium organophilum]|uniref:Uncharacterized protein n=1 Tax=Methylobacterium organophilum TaxID=410 RepID=A0ABQ4T772_METOR|nr:hypothetical protein [Methylobacterium organophilum]UMY17834.1 hypothetical protein MMB17_00235 [Methylobacterium organophilum]GJE25927.1 hypothetical protein LKMONMHP_0771 [Methylobacterium organophilum]